jgi:hypothetical protein
MDAELLALAAAAAGQDVSPLERIADRGYANNERWRVRLADGRSAFVKAAVDGPTAEWLRRERELYGLGAPFMAELLGWRDGERPVLLLEDLSAAHWPPPWRAGDVDAVLTTLELIAVTPAPAGVVRRRAEELLTVHNWPDVEQDPAPFLSLRLCSEDWLAGALPVLLEATANAPFAGESLLHLDVRSDNLCLRDGRALLVDWNWAHVGNPLLDVAGWLPSLAAEGGPAPEEVSPEAGVFASFMAGFFASCAAQPAPATAPRVRIVQQEQLRVALPWAARSLDLPPPR